MPRRLLETSLGYEPRMRGLLDPAVPAATVAGLDLIRDESGELLVLEDNLRMPSGSSYALAVREAVAPALGAGVAAAPARTATSRRSARRSAPPPRTARADPAAAILSDGPDSGAWYEHQRLGRELGIPVVEPGELEVRRGRLYSRHGARAAQLDVLYRRLDEDRLSAADGSLTALGELLLPALESGRLRCVNAFGTGIADDKLAHAYAEAMVRFYLGEEPLLRSVPSFDLSDETVREAGDGAARRPGGEAARRLRRPRGDDHAPRRHRPSGAARSGCCAAAPSASSPRTPSSSPATRPSAAPASAAPGRPAAVRRQRRRRRPTAMAGGLTRYARGAGEMVVNSSRGGGCKDTWVVDVPPSGARR